MSGMIFLLCFTIIFPVTQSGSIQKYEQKSPFAPKCYTSFPSEIFLIQCDDVNVNDLTGMIEEEVKNFSDGKTTIDILRIRNLSTENEKLSQNWINTTSFRISQLEMISGEIDSIENNAFRGYAFEDLKTLQLQGMKIERLQEGTFEGLQSLTLLDLSRCEVNHINENALKAVAATLRMLFVNQMVLPFNSTNLTGTVTLPELVTILMTFNKMSNVDVGSFTQIPNIKTLYLDDNKIEHIDCGNFEKMTLVNRLYLNDNLLTTLDPCVFGDGVINNLEPNSLHLWNNKWNCNCDLDWLKQLKIGEIIADDPKCASHSNLPFENVNFCEKETAVKI
ncbi:uncharacterized protein LOC143911326 [Arctopsyche grandis]|uniref:uncharacterized protein LOC143911326 n=1 Tax=Arctopsyche grandis TaxID=121162 RepID=UPI00406D6385